MPQGMGGYEPTRIPKQAKPRTGPLVHALWVYDCIMAKVIQIRDVPDDVHQRLTTRAAEERCSLSELVRAEIIEVARRPTMSEMLNRLAGRPVTKLPESSANALVRERVNS